MRRHSAAWLPALLFSLVILTTTASATSGETVASVGDASIAHDVNAGSWTVSAGGASMVLTLDPNQDYAMTSLVSPSGVQWLRAGAADSIVTVDGVARVFGRRSDGFAYSSTAASMHGARLELEATFVLVPQNLSATRHIAVVPGSPTFEVWTTFVASGRPVTLSNLDGFQAAFASGVLRWLTGEQRDPGESSDSEFAWRTRSLAAGETLALGSTARSSEGVVPWLAVDGASDELYTALMWSGAWSLNVTRTATGVSLDWGLGPMDTIATGTALDTPHVLVGVARGALPAASAAMQTYILQGLRGGRPFTPLVTYNTWYSYGTDIDEASMRREMARAAAMGVELFVIDAGWYTGADTALPSDFTPGLGSWTVDPDRFPNGLGALAAAAHGLGMKFGIWVEPERITLDNVGKNGLDESSLATHAGVYQSDDSAMICLAGAAGRQWVVDHLTAFLDAVQPDYLKWDNNLWVNCDRDGHGHGATDGNFAHVTALYEVLDLLRQRYPSMLIENCSSGGNRLDFAMLQYTDTAWMSDQTSPSMRVRHNVEGLGAIFPPAYLLAFLTDLGWERLHNSPDLALYARSRMAQAFGVSFRSGGLSDTDIAAVSAQIAFYKRVRSLIAVSTAANLTPQATGAEAQWDVLQETGTTGDVVLFAFSGISAPTTTTVFPVDLSSDAVYRVVTIEGSARRGVMKGADLMANGITLTRSAVTAGQIVLLLPQP